jgi:hypothetical protein
MHTTVQGAAFQIEREYWTFVPSCNVFLDSHILGTRYLKNVWKLPPTQHHILDRKAVETSDLILTALQFAELHCRKGKSN